MVWISVVVGAFCGVLAAGVAVLVVRKRKENPRFYSLVFAGIMALLLALSNEFVTPMIKASYAASNIEDSLLDIPAFAAMKQHDPATYNQIVDRLKLSVSNGQSLAATHEAIQNDIAMLIEKRLPHASDEAAAMYTNVLVQEMTELKQNGGDFCYRFLFPQPGQPLDISRYLSAPTKKANLAALGEVIRTSALSPQTIPTEADVAALIEPIITALAKQHGQDMAILQNPGAPGVDKGKVCGIMIDMYSQIALLPPAQAGKLLRYMLAQP